MANKKIQVPWNKGMKGLLLNDLFIKNNPSKKGVGSPNWKGGITLKVGNCPDCGKKLRHYLSKYCFPCSFKHRICHAHSAESHYRWKGGKPKCIKCGKEIDYKATYCSLCSKLGQNNPNWKGGKSFEPYPIYWKETLKQSIRQRDGYICQICGKEPSINVHHIDYNKENCNPDNLITLCDVCHVKTNFNRDYWINYFK